MDIYEIFSSQVAANSFGLGVSITVLCFFMAGVGSVLASFFISLFKRK